MPDPVDAEALKVACVPIMLVVVKEAEQLPETSESHMVKLAGRPVVVPLAARLA
jgi:hypothetical protein